MAGKRPRTDEDRAEAEALRVKTYNGKCCGGERLAGHEGGMFKFGADESEDKVALVNKTQAGWTDPDKGAVVTKCGNCKKILLPTVAQKKLMAKGLHLVETPELVKLGVPVDELILQLAAGAKALQCSMAEYARVHLQACD